MNYTPIDLSANLNCRAITLKYKRNYKLWPENMNFTTKILSINAKFVALISVGFIDFNKTISSTIIYLDTSF